MLSTVDATLPMAKQCGGAVKSIILFILFLGLIAVLALGAGGYFAYREAVRPGPLAQDAVVMLESGTTVTGIAEILSEAGVIRHPALFEAAVRVRKSGSALKAGEYRIPAEASVMEIIDLLVDGKSILHYFTAPEGRTTAQVLRLLEEDPILSGDIT